MTDKELTRALNSIGKAAFVQHFSLFQGYATGSLSRRHCEAELASYGRGAAWRLNNAVKIFVGGRERDALLNIASSQRVPGTVRAVASELISALSPQHAAKAQGINP